MGDKAKEVARFLKANPHLLKPPKKAQQPSKGETDGRESKSGAGVAERATREKHEEVFESG